MRPCFDTTPIFRDRKIQNLSSPPACARIPLSSPISDQSDLSRVAPQNCNRVIAPVSLNTLSLAPPASFGRTKKCFWHSKAVEMCKSRTSHLPRFCVRSYKSRFVLRSLIKGTSVELKPENCNVLVCWDCWNCFHGISLCPAFGWCGMAWCNDKSFPIDSLLE